jgi:hypothetical protein
MMRESYMRSRVVNKIKMALLPIALPQMQQSNLQQSNLQRFQPRSPWSIMHLKMTSLATSIRLAASALAVLGEASFNTFEHLVLIPKP